jgi:hypothetical protein
MPTSWPIQPQPKPREKSRERSKNVRRQVRESLPQGGPKRDPPQHGGDEGVVVPADQVIICEIVREGAEQLDCHKHDRGPARRVADRGSTKRQGCLTIRVDDAWGFG